MKINFEYSLKSNVRIKSLNTLGLVIGCFYGETGIQYHVTYFLDGEHKDIYVYPEEIEVPSGGETAGFIKS